jgi:hypothetical protein
MNDSNGLPRPDAEAREASPRVVAMLAVLLVFLVALGLAGARLALSLSNPPMKLASHGDDELFQHGAQASTDIERSWQDIDRASSLGADGYAWVDRSAGIVQIPISRAIDLVCAGQHAVRREQGHSSP